jgi:hypothetical protein
MKLSLLAPRRAPSADRPVLCDAMDIPRDGIPAEHLPEWMLLTEKCMAPAEMVMEFSCSEGHIARNCKCGPHSRDPRQFCGFCADLGNWVPVQVTIIRRLA